MLVTDVFNAVPKGNRFYSHAIGYISEGKELIPAELSDWNDANRILYLGEENYYSEEMTRKQSCIRMLQGLYLENCWSFLMEMVRCINYTGNIFP